ncbi:MAG: hypothetical protein ABSA78_06870 [Candidatus Sulfotelmatobacter sp.]|jgi:hypothetical protein
MNLLLRYIPLSLLVLLLWVLLRRRAQQVCPWFFVYVAFGVVADMVRLAVRLLVPLNADVYYATYWISEAGYDVLGMLVMYEVLRAVLGNLTRAWWSRLIFPAVFILGVSLSLARARAVPPQVGGILAYIVVGEIAVRLVQVIVFAGLVTSVPLLGLRWRQYPFGIAAGFGIFSTVALLMTTKFSDFGTSFKLLFGWTLLVAYSVAVLIWIWFFSSPQKAETPNPDVSAPSPGVLKQYLDVLRRMR